MKYATGCSGIEAPSVAWKELDWEAQWFSQFDPEFNYSKGLDFPSRVLKYHYPEIENLGDMTKLYEKEKFKQSTIDLFVAGTPCQSFSIAGLRGGLDDERGNMALEYCRILIAKQPRWFVWENVPGVFSSFSDEKGSEVYHDNGDRSGDTGEYDCTQTSDFAILLQGFRECGYSVAYRVFDSQYFGVPQRRRRVFVIGYLGNDWRPPAAVLFESESLRRDFTPIRKEGQEVTRTLTQGFGKRGLDHNQIMDGGYAIMAHGQGGAEIMENISPTLTCNHEQPIVFDLIQITNKTNRSNPLPGDPSHTISKGNAHGGAIIFNGQGSHTQGLSASEHISPTLDKSKVPVLSVDFRRNQDFENPLISGTLQSKKSGGFSLNYSTGILEGVRIPKA